jgi:SIR2-like protein
MRKRPKTAPRKAVKGSDPADDGHLSTCMVCRDKRPFALPEPLVAAAKSRNLVLFAGAGISTEGRRVFPISLRNQLVRELAAEQHEVPADESFPGICSAYEEVFGASALIQSIRMRLDYALAFPEVYQDATEFHKELATIPGFDSIITTNWDTYFEDEMGAIAIAIPRDYAYWDLPGRKVFKIHGSVTNLSTIVATKRDYASCLRRLRSGVIGASLKHLLATKSALFVGYSFTDEDFAQIYQLLRGEMRDILPKSFIVTLDHRITPATHPGTTVLHTDATFFVSELKRRLVRDKVMIADERTEGVQVMRLVLSGARRVLQNKFPPQRFPAVIFSVSYQDGMADGFDRILAKRKEGIYSHEHDIVRGIDSYTRAEKRAVRRRRFFDAAYMHGYSYAMLYLLMDDRTRKTIPLFFVYGREEEFKTISALGRALKNESRLNPAAMKEARRLASELGPDLIIHHRPFLSPDSMPA